MKELLHVFLILVLLLPGIGLTNKSPVQDLATWNVPLTAFRATFELTDSELSVVEGEGPFSAVRGVILGGILGAATYGSTVDDRTAGGWFVAIAVTAAGGAAAAFFTPLP